MSVEPTEQTATPSPTLPEASTPVDILDLLAQDWSPPAELAPGVLRQGELGVIAAEREPDGAALALGLAVARCFDVVPWLGAPPAPGRTLVVSAASASRVPRLVGRLLEGLGRDAAPPGDPTHGRLFAVSSRSLRLDHADGRERVDQWLGATGADLLVLDNAGRACLESSALLAALDALIERRGVAVLCACALAADWARRIRAAADSLLRLEHHHDSVSILSIARFSGPTVDDRWLQRTRGGWFQPAARARVVPGRPSNAPQPAPTAPSRG